MIITYDNNISDPDLLLCCRFRQRMRRPSRRNKLLLLLLLRVLDPLDRHPHLLRPCFTHLLASAPRRTGAVHPQRFAAISRGHAWRGGHTQRRPAPGIRRPLPRARHSPFEVQTSSRRDFLSLNGGGRRRDKGPRG